MFLASIIFFNIKLTLISYKRWECIGKQNKSQILTNIICELIYNWWDVIIHKISPTQHIYFKIYDIFI